MKNFFKNRFNVIATIFIMLGFIILLQLFNLQIIHGAEKKDQSETRFLKENRIEAKRGEIVDRYGVPIATNRQGFNIEILRRNQTIPERNEMILQLAKMLEKNGDVFIKQIPLEIDPIRLTFDKDGNNNISAAEKSWKKKYEIKNPEASAQEVFDYFRNTRYKIDKSYTDQEAYKIISIRYEMDERGFTSVSPLLLAKDVSTKTVAELTEKQIDFPGVYLTEVYMRKYNNGEDFSHIVGYVGKINAEEYDSLKDEGYDINDTLGKDGLELVMEKYLKGKDGWRRNEVDNAGREVISQDSDPFIAPVPGDKIVLTLDTKLQKAAEESLQRVIKKVRETPDPENYGDTFAGSAVVLDVNTGEVLAMASYPNYDPSVFLESTKTEIRNQKITEWSSPNAHTPFINRAISGIYSPGSTFKLLTGAAGVEEGVIGPYDKIYDDGLYEYGDSKYKCWSYDLWGGGHGPVDLANALKFSCNFYFYDLAKRMGIENLNKWQKKFGLGVKTGIDLPGESAGIIAGPEYREKLDLPWYPGETLISGIGQSDNAFTPLQMANYVNTIANGGKRYVPHVVKKVVDDTGAVVFENSPLVAEEVPLKKETRDRLVEGMKLVTTDPSGTAYNVFKNLPFVVPGKSGTAESFSGNVLKKTSSHALFVAFAPIDNPKISVAVAIEHGVHGNFAGEVIGDIMAEYFKQNKSGTPVDTTLQSDEPRLSR